MNIMRPKIFVMYYKLTLRFMGHIQGLEVNSPSLGLRPALPLNMTAWASKKRWKKFSLYALNETLGTFVKKEKYIIKKCTFYTKKNHLLNVLTARKSVIFDIPNGSRVTEVGITSDFLLFIAPLTT